MSGLMRFTSKPPETKPPANTPPASDSLAGVAEPLKRFLRPRPQAAGETCELCSEPIGEDHRHVVDVEQRGMLCSCRGCGLLFIDARAGRYRTVPDRYLRVQPFVFTPVQWASLQIPVGVAFVVANSQLSQTVAFYPGPGGATESELPLDSWDEIIAANPALADVAADVEAVLLRSDRGSSETSALVVPVDRCYELVGILRMCWSGFDGGSDARSAIESFFDDVTGRARTVGGRGA